jgi:hypothetical protein
MMNVNRKLAAGVIVLFSIVVWAWVLNQMNHCFTVRWLAFQAKRSVNPVELQKWATNLLANHGRRLRGYQDFYGTNMPSSLRKVMPGYPNVKIHNPDEVWVCGESKGGPFLVVGAPSLVTPTNQNIFPWKPGIYFVR